MNPSSGRGPQVPIFITGVAYGYSHAFGVNEHTNGATLEVVVGSAYGKQSPVGV